MGNEQKGIYEFIYNWHEKPPEPAQYTAGDITYTLQSGFTGVYPGVHEDNTPASLPLASLEITYTHRQKPNLKRQLLEMRLKLDELGFPVGLDDGRFNFWYHTYDDQTTYRVEYKVNSDKPDFAQIGLIYKYSPNTPRIDQNMEDIDAGLSEITRDSHEVSLKIPKAVDWRTTFNVYYTLFSNGILVQNGALTNPQEIGQAISQNPLRAAGI